MVVGGGAIGLSIAREAARSGLAVRLLERGRIGGEATGASAGILAAQLEAHEPGPLLSLSLRSRDLYPQFLRDLEAESGVDVDARTDGALAVALDATGAEEIERTYRFQRDAALPVERLDGASLRALEPALSPRTLCGLLLPREWSLDPTVLAGALRIAAERAGVLVLPGEEARRLLVGHGRVTGVVTAAGERHAAGSVVVAAGAWSGLLGGEGMRPPPSEPIRGQIVCFAAPGLVRHVLAGGGYYLVPRGDGRIVAGSTMERAGFDRGVTEEGLETLRGAARALVPRLGQAAIQASWAGLRPAAPDGLPVIGAGPLAGLYYACGHLRNGIVLTPITALIVARLVRGLDAGVDLGPFDPARFRGAP